MNVNSPPPQSPTSGCPSCELDRSRRRCERLLVLGPLGLAIVATAVGAEPDFLAPLWLAAIAWTVLASFALVLAAGLRYGDWSAFRDDEREEDREEEMDLDTRTGGYRFLRERDERVLADRSFPGDGTDRLH